MIVRGMRSADGSASSAGGSVAETRAPPGRRGGGRSGGAAVEGWGRGGEGRRASRSPGLSAVSSSVFTFRSRRRVLGEEGVADQENGDADGDGRVGHVEGGPE